RSRLHAILARDVRFTDGRLVLRVVLLRALERVVQRQHDRRSGRFLQMCEGQRRCGLRTGADNGNAQQQRGPARGTAASPTPAPARPGHGYFPTTSPLRVSGRSVARPPLCDGAVFAVGVYTLCVFSSTAIVRAPRSVATFSATSHLPPDCW